MVNSVEVIAVVGACAPERAEYARWLAETTGRTLVPATRTAAGPDAYSHAVDLASEAGLANSVGVVVEFPRASDPIDVIGSMADETGELRLASVVCVADALHLLSDLTRDDDIDALAPGEPAIASALLTARQLEYASTIVFVNWAPLATEDLSIIMALACHLSPRARLRMQGSGAPGPLPGASEYSRAQERPGWVGLLNSEFDPHMTDRRVSAFRYEHLRPAHPGRLRRMLEEQLGAARFGEVIRSAGFCRLATRSQHSAHWEQVGPTISLSPIDDGGESDAGVELVAFGQELAIIGIDLDHDGLTAALDAVALTDAELAAGPAAWAEFSDSFPAWPTVEWREG
ncbi:MAG: GTP-binding protein [Pseudoclavibacter sp.]